MFVNVMKSIYKSMVIIALGMAYSLQLSAHGGLSLAEDMCKLTIGPYTMHFTGYQPESTQEQEFCEDIPMIGRTVVALDYINEELRPMTTEVRIIRDTGSEEKQHVPEQLQISRSSSGICPSPFVKFQQVSLDVGVVFWFAKPFQETQNETWRLGSFHGPYLSFNTSLGNAFQSSSRDVLVDSRAFFP